MVGASLLLCIFIKVPTLYYDHGEWDERIYWQLALNLTEHSQYSLQGSDLMATLPASVYDRPLFHHPPLFAALLMPFAAAGAKGAAITVSWLGHLLAVFAVALIGRHILARQGEDGAFTSPAFWLPLLGVSTDPLLTFVSRKLWIDSLLAGLAALALAALVVAVGRPRLMRLAGAGALLGLAALAKLSALIVLPLFLVSPLVEERDWRARARAVLAVSLPVCLFVVPWCLIFHARCGAFVPSWVRPDSLLIDRFPFVKAMVERPWYYYIAKLPLLVPLTFVCLWPLAGRRNGPGDRTSWLIAGFFVLALATLTGLGVQGYGFQMRHVALATPALYALLAGILATDGRPAVLAVSAFTIMIGAATGALYLMAPQFDEILSLAEIARLVGFD